jgi:serine/threonine protein phosphatase PrpC
MAHGPHGQRNDESLRSPPFRVRIAAQTDVGRAREHNEDAVLIADIACRGRDDEVVARDHLIRPCVLVLGVFDGMGGEAAGEVASALAANTVYERVMGDGPPLDRDELARRMSDAIDAATATIFAASETDRFCYGMGTTATLAGIADDVLLLAQVGDSRAYLLRGTELVQLTRDQSLVAEMIDAGVITARDALTAPFRSVILQAVGVAATVETVMSTAYLRRGDVLLLCSDGLNGDLDDSLIRDALIDAGSPEEACSSLVDLANAAGGSDNVTCVVVRFDGDGLQPASADEGPPRAVPFSMRSLSESLESERATVRPKCAGSTPDGRFPASVAVSAVSGVRARPRLDEAVLTPRSTPPKPPRAHRERVDSWPPR